MKRLSFASLCHASALVGTVLLCSSFASGQSSASLSGRALNAAGQPISNPVIRLLSDTTSQPAAHPRRYTLIGDSLGKFSQEGIAPGAYLVMLFTDGKAANILRSVSLTAGAVTKLDFNLASSQPVQVATSVTMSSMPGRATTSVQTK